MPKKRWFVVSLLTLLSVYSLAFAPPPVEIEPEGRQKVRMMMFFEGEHITSISQAKGEGEFVTIPHHTAGSNIFGTYIMVTNTRARQDRTTGLMVNRAKMAHSVYVNGRLASQQGAPADTETSTVHRYMPSVVQLPEDESWVEIAIHIANFSGIPGGLDGPVWVGDYNGLFDLQAQNTALNAMVATTSILLSLFFIFSFYYDRDVSHLALAMVGLVISVRQVVVGHANIRSILGSFDEICLIAIDYLSPYILAAALAFFVVKSINSLALLKGHNSPITYLLYLVVYGMPTAATLLYWMGGVSMLHDSLWLVVIAMLVIITGFFILTKYKKTASNAGLLIGYAVIIAIFVSTMWDTGVAMDLIDGRLISTYTLIAMLFLEVMARIKEGKQDAINYGKAVARYESELTEKRTIEQRSREISVNYRALAEELIRSKEESNSRMVREIHDSISFPMQTAGRQMLETMEKIAGDHPEEARQLGEKAELLFSGRESFRRNIRDYHPESLESSTLKTILEVEIRLPESITYIPIIDNSTVDLTVDSKVNIFRVCQEAASNMLKYSNANLFHIVIEPGVMNGIEIWTIRISDNGIGANLAECSLNGVDNIKARFQMMKGDVTILTSPGHGFSYNGWIPRSPNAIKSLIEAADEYKAKTQH